MTKRLLYISLLALFASCSNEIDVNVTEPEYPEQNAGEMIFMARAATLSRASSNGSYNQDYYPVNKLFLTAYHRDNLNTTQWYFQDIMLDATDALGNKIIDDTNILSGGEDLRYWKAKGWYWPIQGKMELLSYWSPKVYGEPKFYEYIHADGSTSAQMVVNARGSTSGGERYEGLDGYTDFLYIAQNNVPCPQTQPYGLLYKHGLAWLTVSLQAVVSQRDASGNVIENSIDDAKTDELIDKVKVQKIVIEDLSRKGTAYLVPGEEVAWVIHPDDIKDQIYTRPDTATSVRGNYAYFTWDEVDDGRSYYTSEYVTLSKNKQYLGLYRPRLYDSDPGSYQPDTNHDTEYVGNGLLVIPQHKTSITVYFLIKGGRLLFNADGTPDLDAHGVQKTGDLEVAEKFDLHDNDKEWEPGKRYQYDIKFTSSVDSLKDKFQVVLSETTYEIKVDPVTTCYDKEAFGQLVITDGVGGTTITDFKSATFVLDPLHNEGSPFSDEMDYFDGGKVF